MVFAFCALECFTIFAVMPTITGVTAKQRYPWNGKVDITYALTGDVTAGLPAWNKPFLLVTVSNRVDGAVYDAVTDALSGDTGTAEGTHHVLWDLNVQGLEFKSGDVVFTVAYTDMPKPYCVIDLAAGANASSYPISYIFSVPSGGWTDEYKTTKLVLRRIEPGTFMMCGQYDVTLTKPFYCGIFEVTQKQYELVTGVNPCSSTVYGKGDAYPVHYVTYNMIRGTSDGATWPSSSTVDSSSFLGKLRARTGLDFDLPTEAQWEYACRSGTSTTYSYGNSANGSYMWYSDNSSGTSHPVGMKNANAWGLYDMHGNVEEWCLDWRGTLACGTDPNGPASGAYRVVRGASWHHDADDCTPFFRGYDYPSGGRYNYGVGFRLVRTLFNANGGQSPEAAAGAERVGIICSGDSASVAVDSRVVEPALDTIILPWDASWIGGDTGATVVIADNGTGVRWATGAGEFTHTLSGVGRHELTYTTYIRGVAQDEVYATTVYTASAQWKYNIVDDGAFITGSMQKIGTVTIPSEVDGYPVTGIAAGVFEGECGIETVTLPSTLRFVGERAFKDCSLLEKIVLPDSVTSIGIDAFAGCSGLRDVTAPQCVCSSQMSTVFPAAYSSITNVVICDGTTTISTRAFSGCSGLTSVTIPDSVTGIGERAFYGCSDLTSVTIPDSVTSIGEYAFAMCSSLKSATFLGKEPIAGYDIFSGSYGLKIFVTAEWNGSQYWQNREVWLLLQSTDVVIPGGFSVRWNCAGMTNITSVIFEEGVTRIESGAFYGCTGITNVVFPNSLRSIGWEAFYGCTGLTEITMPTNLYDIGSRAFGNCSNLALATILCDRVFSGIDCFYGCPNLTNISIRADVNYFRLRDLLGVARQPNLTVTILPGITTLREHYFFMGDDYMKELRLPEGLETIGQYAISSCWGLKSVVLPQSLRHIEYGAFRSCRNLGSVNFPQNLKHIGEQAFAYCRLRDVSFFEGLESIGSYSFASCPIDCVEIPSSVTNIGVRAFGNLDVTNILVNASNPSYLIADGVLYGIEDGRRITLLQASTSLAGRFEIPATVKTIYPEAFAGCTRLTHVVIPSMVTDLKSFSFSGCTNLVEVVVPDSVTNISATAFRGVDFSAIRFSVTNELYHVDGNFIYRKIGEGEYELLSVSEVFGGQLVVPDFVTGIAADSVRQNQNITKLVIGENVSYIGNDAFYGCKRLAEVAIGGGSIGRYAFGDCDGLARVTLGDGVTSIGDNAFYYCTNLLSVAIPPGIATVGDDAFYGCKRLAEVAIGGGSIGRYAFGYCDGLARVTLGDGVTLIGDDAFYYCTNLCSIAIPPSVETIGENAFYRCKRLAEVSIGGGSIGRYAFEYCDGLASVSFGDDVISIGDNVFYYCTNLCSVAIPPRVASIGNSAFYGCTRLTAVSFLGDVPTCGLSIYGWNAPVTNYVTSVWTGPTDTWQDRPVKLIADSVVTVDGKEVSVPMAWLLRHSDVFDVAEENALDALNAMAANGKRSVAECYVLGIDPEDEEDDFKITAFEIVNGEPVFTLSHTEDGSGVSFETRIRKLGKANLGDDWAEVPAGGNPAFRFFKVCVELP